mmetsp:Transcript_37498/g.82102  ORF Transcript_37498/g.82102 Transcript_37498/m.82102 type:complete len:82 (+) Transcript_37498:1572-1817(+)
MEEMIIVTSVAETLTFLSTLLVSTPMPIGGARGIIICDTSVTLQSNAPKRVVTIAQTIRLLVRIRTSKKDTADRRELGQKI